MNEIEALIRLQIAVMDSQTLDVLDKFKNEIISTRDITSLGNLLERYNLFKKYGECFTDISDVYGNLISKVLEDHKA